MNIKGYLISKIQNIDEFKALRDAVEPEILDIQEKINNLKDDQFIETATEKGIERREKLLRIQPFFKDTLKSRRFRVGVKWDTKLPYTYRKLEDRLSNLVGEDGYIMTRNLEEKILIVKINLGVKRMLQDVEKMIDNMIPCTFIISVDLQYNRHIDLNTFTHEQLAIKTHLQLRIV